jgi:hypothetical protein
MAKSLEYEEFLKEIERDKRKNTYERACEKAERILPLKPWMTLYQKYSESIAFSHLKITPKGAFSLATLATLLVMLVPAFVALPFLILSTPQSVIDAAALSGQAFPPYFGDFLKILTITGIFAGMVFYYLYDYPNHYAVVFRIKASAEMVLAIIYMTISMRVTPNLENATRFTARNLTGPLAYDLKRLIWDVYNRKYNSLSEAFDYFIDKWKKENEEFTQAIFLIKTASSESSSRLERNLDEAVSVMLQGTKDRMKSYAQELRAPVTSLNALGILMPIIGLVFFPIVSVFLPDLIQPAFLVVGYDALLPFVVYIMMKNYLDKRPYTFHQPDVTRHPRFANRPFFGRSFFMSVAIGGGVIGMGIWGMLTFTTSFSTPLLASSILTTVGASGFIISYLYLSTREKLKMRNEIAKIEDEFAEVLFQIGSQLRRGVPIETTLKRIVPKLKDFTIARFFEKIMYNIETFGMTFEQAIFDPKHGAMSDYPSKLIEAVMRATTEISKRGMDVMSKSMITISSYLKDVKSVENDLKDMMSEVTSTMQVQANILAPLSTGIVVAVTAIVFQMLLVLQSAIDSIKSTLGSAGTIGAAGQSAFESLIQVNQIMPVQYFQMLVGVYMIEIVVMLATFLSVIQNGDESILRRLSIAKTLFWGTLIYAILSLAIFSGFSSLIPLAGI